jgi:hypothetical protein
VIATEGRILALVPTGAAGPATHGGSASARQARRLPMTPLRQPVTQPTLGAVAGRWTGLGRLKSRTYASAREPLSRGRCPASPRRCAAQRPGARPARPWLGGRGANSRPNARGRQLRSRNTACRSVDKRLSRLSHVGMRSRRRQSSRLSLRSARGRTAERPVDDRSAHPIEASSDAFTVAAGRPRRRPSAPERRGRVALGCAAGPKPRARLSVAMLPNPRIGLPFCLTNGKQSHRRTNVSLQRCTATQPYC